MVLGETRFAFCHFLMARVVLKVTHTFSKSLTKIFIPLHTITASFPNMAFYDDSCSNSEEFLKKSWELEHFTRGAAQGPSQALTLFLGVL